LRAAQAQAACASARETREMRASAMRCAMPAPFSVFAIADYLPLIIDAAYFLFAFADFIIFTPFFV
jgi:hypothetical protein